MGEARLSIICVTYEKFEPLRALIHSFMSQTLQNFHLNIIHDGPNDEFNRIAGITKQSYGAKIDFAVTQKRFNDNGHSLREIGLSRCSGDFVLLTNGDNYYAPVFLERMFNKIDSDGLDLVLCDMIHSHNRPGRRNQSSYKPFITFPSIYHIDMGAFIVRTDLAKGAGFADKSYAADGVFIERIMASNNRSVKWGKVDDVLFMHN